MDVAAYRRVVSTVWHRAVVVATTAGGLVTGRFSGGGHGATAVDGGHDGTGPRAAPDRAAGVPAGPARRQAARRPLSGTPARVPARRPGPAADRGTGPARSAPDTPPAAATRAGEARNERPREAGASPPAANPPTEEPRAEPRGTRRRGRAPRRRPRDTARAPAAGKGGSPPPGSFTELLERLDEFPTLRFTGDRKVTRRLDERAMPNWIVTCWDALKALEDFAADSAAGRAGGNFRAWCRNLPPGRHPFPAGKVRMKESETVRCKSAWRRERMLPVPRTVHPSGRVYMEAHLRIGAGNAVSPRLHFHDDTAGTGLLYIGYIGPHLTNTRTT
ncbi:hypothetical protein V1L54_26380 [Streptomyces sp. TRM 70361]|uniref:hypothetical protein n=1 Tax=Streptomyces sp. TRM 70361 TaxID=3116553 RepID=UPI002E7B5D0A|nr:hypothetical protein [Streptomyces sp. TRM 70361]MEE1942893.1 hypothetical protein [Streptomyces sp. TRM 70361]